MAQLQQQELLVRVLQTKVMLVEQKAAIMAVVAVVQTQSVEQLAAVAVQVLLELLEVALSLPQVERVLQAVLQALR